MILKMATVSINQSLETVAKNWLQPQPAKETGRNIFIPLGCLMIKICQITPIAELPCDQGSLSCRDRWKTAACLFRQPRQKYFATRLYQYPDFVRNGFFKVLQCTDVQPQSFVLEINPQKKNHIRLFRVNCMANQCLSRELFNVQKDDTVLKGVLWTGNHINNTR